MTQRVVITGGSRGIGKGLAFEFLSRGHDVAISGRSQGSVDRAVADLKHRAEGSSYGQLLGVPCLVDDFDQVQNLWDRTFTTFGGVDIWINNAGISNRRALIGELDRREIKSVPNTNLLGTMFGAKVALAGMTQQGHGAIYNFEGLGSNGRTMNGLSLYGATKYAITYFTKCLIKETRNTPVRVGYLSPGIVLTHLSLEGSENMPPERRAHLKKMFNILADRVETVTPWLVDKILANKSHGARIAWLTNSKAAWRFLNARFVKRDLFTDLALEQRDP